LTISTSSLPGAAPGQVYTATLTASGGTAPYTWKGTSLPSWLTLSASSGTLSGTPPAGGTFTISVQVSDSTTPTAKTASKNFTLVVTGAALSITTVSQLPAGMVGVAYPSTTLAAAGGTTPYTWVILSGNTDGLMVDSGGVISGKPLSAGTFNFTVQVTDNTGITASKAFALTVTGASPLRITSSSQLPAGTLGSSYTFQMAASGGVPPYTWSATGLPAGLTITSAGLISGPIGAAGSISFVVTVTDSVQPPSTSRNNFQISVTPPVLPAITISGLPSTADPSLPQYTVTIGMASAYPVNLTGTAILSSAPTDNGPSDGTIQFSTGGKSASFTIPAGSTSTTLALQTGTVAGAITLTLSQLSAGGTDVTPTPGPSAKTQIAVTAPVIKLATVSRNASTNTLTIQITGYATSREMTQAVFTFSASPGQSLQTSQFTIQLGTLFQTFYQNSQNASTGSQFVFSQPFTIQGDINSVIPQNVTLTNRVGSTPSAIQ